MTPGEPGYDEGRTVFYGGIDRRPAAIVRAADADDVSRAIALARETGVELAVRSGGHSIPGHSTTDGGIVLDLRDLNGLEIDVEALKAQCHGARQARSAQWPVPAVMSRSNAITTEDGQEADLCRHRWDVHRLLLRLGRQVHPGEGADHASQPRAGVQRGTRPGLPRARRGPSRPPFAGRLGALCDDTRHECAD